MNVSEHTKWLQLESFSLVLAFIALIILSVGMTIPGLAVVVYLGATACSILAGQRLKLAGETADEILRNNNVHKWGVLVLNGLVGVGCAYYIGMYSQEAQLPGWILGSFFALYILSWATGLIRPHSFWARYRSVLLRVVLTTAMVGIMWKPGYWLAPIAAIPVLLASWRHLRRDQAQLGWPNR